mgnify:CR=1 FL=1
MSKYLDELRNVRGTHLDAGIPNYIGESISDILKLQPNDGNGVLLPGLMRVNRDLTISEYLSEYDWTYRINDLEAFYEKIKDSVKLIQDQTGKRLLVQRRGPGWDAEVTCIGVYYNRMVNYELQFLEDYDSLVVIPKLTHNPSERTAIYNEAKKLKMRVSIEDMGEHYDVSLRNEKYRSKATKQGYDAKLVFVLFVKDLPYDTPTTIPDDLAENTSDGYLRLMCTQSPYELSYRRGYITKHRYRLCNVDGGVSIRTNGQTLTRLENVKTSTLSPQQIALLNMRMLPYGVTVTDDKELRYDHD